MPLQRTKANLQTSQNVSTNAEVEALKKTPDVNLANGGLNDETIHATINPLTSSEANKVVNDTQKVNNMSSVEFSK